MRINVTAKNFNLSDDLKDEITKEVAGLEKFYQPILDAEVIVTEEKYRHTVEVILQIKGTRIYGKDESSEIRTSLDKSVGKLKKQLEKFKAKQRKKSMSPDELIMSGKVYETSQIAEDEEENL